MDLSDPPPSSGVSVGFWFHVSGFGVESRLGFGVFRV